METLQKRHRIFAAVRAFFDERDFLELHTPLLVPNPGLEPHLIPFETRYEPQMGGGEARTFYLPTSPEYHLKKALAGGIPRLYEITRSFRNGEKGREHEPEFFMLEWYRHPGSYEDIAQDFRELMAQLGERFSQDKAWKNSQNLSVRDAYAQFCQIDLEEALMGGTSLTQQAIARGHQSIRPDDDFDTTFHKLMVELIEPKLGFEGPLFLWNYPASMCALARVHPSNPLYCERFEVYWRGVELANAFGELTDAQEQRRRCQEDQALRIKLYGKTPPLDEEFLNSLEALKHPAGGVAVGLDRLVQCLLGLPRLQQVIAFPHADSL